MIISINDPSGFQIWVASLINIYILATIKRWVKEQHYCVKIIEAVPPCTRIDLVLPGEPFFFKCSLYIITGQSKKDKT